MAKAGPIQTVTLNLPDVPVLTGNPKVDAPTVRNHLLAQKKALEEFARAVNVTLDPNYTGPAPKGS